MKAYFTKRPDVFEAVQWTGRNFEEVRDFLDPAHTPGFIVDNEDGTLTVNTAAVQMLEIGDWIAFTPSVYGKMSLSDFQLVSEGLGVHRYDVKSV